MLVATVIGRAEAARMLGHEPSGAVWPAPDDPRVSHASRLTGQVDVIQPRSEVVRSFGAELELVDYVAQAGQDVIVLRRPA